MQERVREKVLSMEEIAALGDAIAETAAVIDAATHRFLTQLREFDRVGGWHRAGALSCAHWLSWRVGMDLGAAREKVRVATRLAELPVIDAALARGEISYCKVRAMTRIATADNEVDLLGMARNTTGSQLEKICRLKRSVNKLGAAAAKEQEDCRRYVIQRSTDDGMVSTQVRLHPEEAARFMRALQLLGGGNLADGAVAMADLALSGAGTGGGAAAVEPPPAAGPDASPAVTAADGPTGEAAPVGEDAPEGASAPPPRQRIIRPPVEVVLHISAADLQGVTELGDGISAEVCRRALCDAGVVPMLEDERGRTIDVGRKTRTIPAALGRALAARDGGCRFPGCSNRRFVDGHHIVHWIDGGVTSLDNTVLLCRRHHRYIHECGFSVERRGEELVFRDPRGAPLRPQAERPPLVADFGGFLDHWFRQSIAAPQPGWDGEQVDYDRCIAALD
ncbi:MAG TPA: DUF222 domain-containing protein [Kofleriaceae bacterium]|nr:DUF222 domain-containing protein [Kofleriaceae bacterium]